MKRIALLLWCLSLLAAAGEWPADLTYRGKPRTDQWWDTVYVHFRTRILCLGDAFVDIGAADAWHTALEPRVAGRVRGKIIRVDNGSSCYVRLYGYRDGVAYSGRAKPHLDDPNNQVIYAALDSLPTDGNEIADCLAAVAWHEADGRRYLKCVPCPTKSAGITKGQFIEAIKGGFPLADWRYRIAGETPKAGGTGHREWYRRFVQ